VKILSKGDFAHSDAVVNGFNKATDQLSLSDIVLIFLEYLDDDELEEFTEYIEERND
jgi:hypothetical protein